MDYGLEIAAANTLRVHGLATWQPRFERRFAAELPVDHYVGFTDGALRWRAIAGIDWRNGAFAAGLTGQFFDSYHDSYHARNALGLANQVSLRIPPQFYLDLQASYRFQAGADRWFDVRVGVANVLGHDPPTVINNGVGYSPYGDPRDGGSRSHWPGISRRRSVTLADIGDAST